jgi:copper chaperone CopZ
LNSILATSLSINKVKFSNNLSSLCTISIITCLDNISSIQKEDSDVKKQTELILEQVNPTKLKEWINNLSYFHTRHTKSNHIENVAYWIKNELETLCENRVFFQNFTQRDDNQTFQLKNYHL